MAETYLFSGNDIQIPGLTYISGWEGQFSVPDLRGDDATAPARDGALHYDRPFATSVFTIGIELLADSLAERNDALRELLGVIKPGKVQTCTRRRTYGTGDANHTASVRYLSGFDPSLITSEAARMLLAFVNLDGLWYGSPVTIGAGTSDVLGDVRTQRMTLTLPGGVPAPTVTNTTNGYSFTFGGTLATPTVIDNEALTAMRGGVDVANSLTWNVGRLPFRLEAGSNTITIDSGTVSIDYSPAYL